MLSTNIPIGNICKKICSGGTPKSTIAEYYDGDIPWLNTKEIDFNRIYTTEKKITELGLKNSSAKWILPNTIAVAMYGATAGKVAIVMQKMTTNQACCNLMIDESLADYRYVYYALSSRYSELASLANGGAQQNLSAQIIKNFEIPLPELATQRKIAAVLSSLDDKIELNAQINHNLEEQAKAIFKSWFVDFEPFQDGKFVDSELGRIPQGWKATTLGKVTNEIRERINVNSDRVFSAVKTGDLILSEEYFTKQVFSKDTSKYIKVNPLCFAYNPARINIGSIGMNQFSYTGCVSPVYVVFSAEKGYHNYLSLLFRQPYFKEEVKVRASGSVRQSLSYQDFSLIPLVYPTQEVILRFNDLHDCMAKTIKHSQLEIEHLTQLRDSLLPKLMSGEIDVSEVEI